MPVLVTSAAAVFFPLTLIVLPLRMFQTRTLLTARGFGAFLAPRLYATRSPSTASATTGCWRCVTFARCVVVVPAALATSARPDSNPAARTRSARGDRHPPAPQADAGADQERLPHEVADQEPGRLACHGREQRRG